MTPFFWVENHESFGFFSILSRKVFPGPDSMRCVWGGVGRALMRFMHFLAIFAMLTVLATSVTPVLPTLEGCGWGCCDSICLLGYDRHFFCSP